MEINLPKISLTKIAGIIGTVGAIAGGLFTFDARYNPSRIEAALEATKMEVEIAKTEMINELRTEVAINRSAMLSNMLRDADDIEFQIEEYRINNQQPPRFLIEKHKQILRDIEELKSHATTSSGPN